MIASRFLLAQRLSAAAVFVLGFLALGLSGALGPLAAFLAAASVCVYLWDGRPRLPERTWQQLGAAFLVTLVLAQLLHAATFLQLFARLLLFLQVHRLLTRASPQDDLYGFLLAFVQLLYASILTISALYFLLFVGFLPTLVSALMLARLASSVEAAWRLREPGWHGAVPAATYRELDPLIRWPYLLVVSLLALALLVGSVLLFFLIPRMQAGAHALGLVPPMNISGFSDHVRLGEVGMLKLSDEPVMRIRVTDRGGEPFEQSYALYWHGLALDSFDGRDWWIGDPTRTRLQSSQARREDGPPSGPWILRAEVRLEPIAQDVLFVLRDLVGLYGPFDELDVVETEGFYLTGAPRRLRYVLYADPRRPDSAALRRQDPRDAPPSLLARYTRLPELDPRLRTLAETQVAGSTSAYDEALSLQNWLRSDFVYSLDQPASAYSDPLAAFLFDVRAGHCEYFATALAVLLRLRGIPTRTVNGFVGAEWNPVGGYWVIRQRHAHSWVEVWFPEAGWVIFDPTPGAEAGVMVNKSGLLASLRSYADYGRVIWSELLLDYGLEDQASALQGFLRRWKGRDASLISALLHDADRPGEQVVSGGPRRWWGLLLGLAVALVMLLGAAFLVRRRRGRLSDRRLRAICRELDALERRWRRAAARLDGGGPSPGASSLDWANWAAEQDPERFAAAPAVIEGYYRARFGGHEPADGLPGELRRLRRAGRGWRASPLTGSRPPAS